MIDGIHFLLTYQCTYECDHCFLHCSPKAEGTFTISQVQQALKEIAKIKSKDLNTDTIEMIERTIEGTARSMGIRIEK